MKKGYSLFIFILLLGLSGVYAQQRVSINDENSYEKFFQQERSKLKSAENGKERNRLFESNPRLKSFSQHNEGDTFSLDFFENKKYDAVVKRVTIGYDGIIGITAQILDIEAGYCFITVSDAGVSISAELPQKDEFFSIFKLSGKNYLSEQKLSDVQKNMEGGCEQLIPEVADEEHIHQEAVIANDATPSNAPVAIRLMVIYTPAAKQYALAEGTNIDDMIDLAIQRSNLVLANSLTNVTLQLVHKQEVDYVEGSTPNDDLRNITNPNDGIIDEVHIWRSQYQADLVSFVVGNTGSNVAGAGWVLNYEDGNPRNGFSAVRVNNIANSYTMIHEIGHNMGCGHHIETDKTALYAYSHGRRSISSQGTRYTTVMAYETGGSYSVEPAILYPRIPYFSDPNIQFEGSPIGENGKEENARTIRQTKEEVGRYTFYIPFIDAFLKDIAISEGTLTPAFNPAITQYSVTVGNSVTSIDVTGITNSPYSTVSNGTGKQLAVGDNVVELKVESDWADKKTYKVTITRQQDIPTTVPPTVSEKKDEYLYPNPVLRGEMLSLVTAADAPLHNATIEVYDLTGNLIQRISVNDRTSSVQAPAEPGIYIFVFKTGNWIKKRMEVLVK